MWIGAGSNFKKGYFWSHVILNPFNTVRVSEAQYNREKEKESKRKKGRKEGRRKGAIPN